MCLSGEVTQDGGKSKYGGPEVGGVCLECSSNSREASGAEAGLTGGGGKGDKARE